MNRGQTMGPPASEPAQLVYVVEMVDAAGVVVERWLERSHHALDACRSIATFYGIGKPHHEYAPAAGVWCLGGANHVVRATADTPNARALLAKAPCHYVRAPGPPSNDERAATQRSIANAIREADRSEIIIATASIHDAADRIARGALISSYQYRELAALAACAADPAILDAVRQVAQVHALEGGG